MKLAKNIFFVMLLPFYCFAFSITIKNGTTNKLFLKNNQKTFELKTKEKIILERKDEIDYIETFPLNIIKFNYKSDWWNESLKNPEQRQTPGPASMPMPKAEIYPEYNEIVNPNRKDYEQTRVHYQERVKQYGITYFFIAEKPGTYIIHDNNIVKFFSKDRTEMENILADIDRPAEAYPKK